MNEKEVESLLKETKAILEGHFLLTSGLHSPLYVEKFNVLQHPEYTEKLCQEFANHFKDMGIETVIGPATGGIILSQVTARLLGVRSIFTERENGKMTLRRGFKVAPGEKVLIVEDIVTTGGSIKEVVDVVNEAKGDIVGIGLLGQKRRQSRLRRTAGKGISAAPPHRSDLQAGRMPALQRRRADHRTWQPSSEKIRVRSEKHTYREIEGVFFLAAHRSCA